jgi:hypothetical protein
MTEFPDFMQHPANRIATTSQATPGVEGYVFDGADGSQMAFWTCRETTSSASHIHDYDEYMLVVQGSYTLIIDGKKIPVNAGEEYFIPRGVRTAVKSKLAPAPSTPSAATAPIVSANRKITPGNTSKINARNHDAIHAHPFSALVWCPRTRVARNLYRYAALLRP